VLSQTFAPIPVSAQPKIASGQIHSEDPNVGGNDALDAYVGSGGLLLPNSYTGTPSSRETISRCLGCIWKYTIYCATNSVGFCAHAVTTCGPGKVRYRIWFGRSAKELKLMGSVCADHSKPATRREVERHIKQQTLRYVPPLRPGIAPAKVTLTSVPISGWSGQKALFRPSTMSLSGRKVWISARAIWLWDWGDGTGQWTANPGARYPAIGNRHQYRKSGRYQITVRTVWQATFTVAGVGTFPASGQLITQEKTLKVLVKNSRAVLTVPETQTRE
ncbi:MAG: PKD domain-containing protein, partial [Actinomycetales bacterium]|nr:PKD domain-containing protein [Actinomycetales bacterium]